MRLVNLVHNHPDSSGFGGFLTDFLWTLATIFFFQNSLGLPYLYQSLNNNGFFFIRIQSGDNTTSVPNKFPSFLVQDICLCLVRGVLPSLRTPYFLDLLFAFGSGNNFILSGLRCYYRRFAPRSHVGGFSEESLI